MGLEEGLGGVSKCQNMQEGSREWGGGGRETEEDKSRNSYRHRTVSISLLVFNKYLGERFLSLVKETRI